MTLNEELKGELERWEYLKKYGGSDPTWEDGCNMNLVRNHIINIKRKMEEENQTTDSYYKETPPEVDNKYMARAEEIRINARKSLEIYKVNNDYKYLLNAIKSLDKRQIEDTCISNVIHYVTGLEKDIEQDNLVSMRRHERYETYLESFVRCRKKVEEILDKKLDVKKEIQLNVQISIMDFIGV